MYSDQRTLAQDIKQQVLDDLRQKNYIDQPPSQRDVPLETYQYGTRGSWGRYSPYTADYTYDAIKDSVKNEILEEINMQQMDRLAQAYGLNRSLSDRRVQRMIDNRYRSIDDMKSDIKRDILNFQRMEDQRSRNPYTRQAANTLIDEAQRRGIPLEQLVQGLDRRTGTGTGIMARLSDMLNTGQRKGFLSGMAMMALCNVLFPSIRNNMQSVAVRSVEEGMAMVERAKTFISGQQQPPQQQPPPQQQQQPPQYQQQQNPPGDLTNLGPQTPPNPN